MRHQPNSEDLTPIASAAQAFRDSARASAISARTVGAEGHAAAILALIGFGDLARSTLDDGVGRFAEALDAGTTDVLGGVEHLLGAAVALGDFTRAREQTTIHRD